MPLALAGALVVGLSLGLLGSGGSILTVPILVYLLGQPDKLAIAGSLAIVGGVSLIGAVPYALKRQVEWRSVVFFGVPGMGGALLGATVARYVSGSLQLLLFALVIMFPSLITCARDFPLPLRILVDLSPYIVSIGAIAGLCAIRRVPLARGFGFSADDLGRQATIALVIFAVTISFVVVPVLIGIDAVGEPVQSSQIQASSSSSAARSSTWPTDASQSSSIKALGSPGQAMIISPP